MRCILHRYMQPFACNCPVLWSRSRKFTKLFCTTTKLLFICHRLLLSLHIRVDKYCRRAWSSLPSSAVFASSSDHLPVPIRNTWLVLLKPCRSNRLWNVQELLWNNFKLIVLLQSTSQQSVSNSVLTVCYQCFSLQIQNKCNPTYWSASNKYAL